MSKMKNHDGALPVHLEDDAIISYLDGELSDDVQSQIRQHLVSCWDCRSRLKITQDSIEKFMGVRREILLPQEIPPTGPALNLFRERLEIYKTANQSVAYSLFSRSYWHSKFKSFNFFSKYKTLVSGSSPLPLRIGIAAVAVLIIAVLVFQVPTTISAAELLRNANEARNSKLKGVDEPVLYQKIQVRSITADKADKSETVSWETWGDAAQKRFREATENAGGRQFINSTNKESEAGNAPPLLTELDRILRANNMNPQSPLSAASFQAWRDSLKQKQEEVTKNAASDGADIFVLHTIPVDEINFGQISEAAFSVRARDWNPFKLQLKVKQPGGTLVYELTEQISEVIAFSQLPPEIFPAPQLAEASKPSASPKESTSPSPETALQSNSMLSEVMPSNKSVNRPVATAELEIEVLNLLSQAKADMGEQITAHREADGLLYVRGIVETAQRKNEILSALQSVQNNPAVKIEIQTVSEAVAGQKQNGKNDSPTTNVQGVEIQSRTIAAEPQLRAFFERQGGNADEAIRNYAASRVAQSRQAMQHLGALKKLANQFSPEELKTLKPEAREKWLALVRRHARAFQEQNAALRRDLKVVFFAGADEGPGNIETVVNDVELISGIRRLFEFGAANDGVIRSAFTASSGARVSAIGSPQFWKALKDAEALAQRIQNFR